MDVTVAAAPIRAGSNSITRRRGREVVSGVVVLVLAAALPLVVRDVYLQNLMIITLLFAGLSQAWNVLGGYCGQISLGHALYMGIGAYVSTLLFVHAGVPPTVGMFAGGAVAALCALLVGWPCFRLSGHYYAIATVVVGEIGFLLFQNSDLVGRYLSFLLGQYLSVQNWDLVGGSAGVVVPFKGDSWATLQFRTSKWPYHEVAVLFVAVTWVVAFLIEGSRWGFAWRAVRDDVVAARSLAVRVFPSKMAAAAISGGLTGVGGAIYAQYVGFIDPDSIMAGHLSILIALPAVLGGVGTLWGPLLGAAVLIPLSELTRSYLGSNGQGADLMIYGGLIMLVALLRPAGLVSLFVRPATVSPRTMQG